MKYELWGHNVYETVKIQGVPDRNVGLPPSVSLPKYNPNDNGIVNLDQVIMHNRETYWYISIHYVFATNRSK